MNCIYCGSPVSDERVEIGYTHCMSRSCVDTWRQERLEAEFALHLIPKQGYAIVPKTEMVVGRSSGRTI